MKTNEQLKRTFTNLQAGDVINIPSLEISLVVIRSKDDDSKLVSTKCGDYLDPLNVYIAWSDEKNMPVKPNDEQVFNFDWTTVEVDQGACVELARRYQDFPMASDYLTQETFRKAQQTPKEVIGRVSAIASFSRAGEGLTAVAVLKTLGVGITDEQAYLVHEALSQRRRQISGVTFILGG